MSTYLHKNDGASETFDLTGRDIYGASRLGLYRKPVSMLAAGGPPAFQYDIPGYRQYELTNHASAPLSTGLGNVTSTITAQKVPIVTGGNLTGYMPQIIHSYDYSPFGVTRLAFDVTAMSSTHPVGDGYRYGFNGMETDDEVKGAGNHVDFGARGYDPRLGRWLAVDPLFKKYPDSSPYSGMANSPISIVDIDGRDNIIYLVVLPSATSKMSKSDYKAIAAEATARLRNMGIESEVRFFDPEINGEFNAKYIDNNDTYALLGSVSEIKAMVGAVGENPKAKEGFVGGFKTAMGWGGTSGNPEQSKAGIFKGEKAGKWNLLGQGILIDSDGINRASSVHLGISEEDGLVLTILHGATHNVGNPAGHFEDGLGLSGTAAAAGIKVDGLDEIYSRVRNKKIVTMFNTNMGTNAPTDNYLENKEKSDDFVGPRQQN